MKDFSVTACFFVERGLTIGFSNAEVTGNHARAFSGEEFGRKPDRCGYK